MAMQGRNGKVFIDDIELGSLESFNVGRPFAFTGSLVPARPEDYDRIMWGVDIVRPENRGKSTSIDIAMHDIVARKEIVGYDKLGVNIERRIRKTPRKAKAHMIKGIRP